MPPLAAHRPDAVHKGVLHQQHRCGVLAAEGGQTAKLLHIVKAQLSQRYGGIKLQADGLGLRGVVGSPGIDGLTEGGQVVLLNFDTGCCRMAAENGSDTVRTLPARCADQTGQGHGRCRVPRPHASK